MENENLEENNKSEENDLEFKDGRNMAKRRTRRKVSKGVKRVRIKRIRRPKRRR